MAEPPPAVPIGVLSGPTLSDGVFTPFARRLAVETFRSYTKADDEDFDLKLALGAFAAAVVGHETGSGTCGIFAALAAGVLGGVVAYGVSAAVSALNITAKNSV